MYPEIHLTTDFSLPTYLVMISLTYCLALIWLVKRADQLEMDRSVALDVAFAVMVGGFVGARLFHVFYEMPGFYLNNPGEIVQFWKGGFVFYGGAILGFFSGWLVLCCKKQTLGVWADLYAPIGALGYALGRFACLLNGCCYGSHCDLPWSIKGRHPAPLYASLIELGILGILLVIERRRNQKRFYFDQPGQLFLIWIGLHGVARIFMELLRDDDRGSQLFGLSVSTWISSALIAISLIILTQSQKASKV